ncbi:YciI family protein [Aquincola sp. J276]|uniref:YciI family protein n=1 Tax=Aquincola sp. J276 TaxID=2898432 RepID=UPI002151D0CB|nr:YciI family protein [Aquincola sp. J276]MCR5866075.1 YciI family protein [Aquincola sp. J276]
MSYLLLIREPLGQRAERGEAAGRQLYDRMLGFAAELQSRGVLLAAESLADMGPNAARIQVREGRRTVIDGPFTETKEMVGGIFLIDVATREEALAIAAECPAAQWCTVEVRQTAPCWDRSAAG